MKNVYHRARLVLDLTASRVANDKGEMSIIKVFRTGAEMRKRVNRESIKDLIEIAATNYVRGVQLSIDSSDGLDRNNVSALNLPRIKSIFQHQVYGVDPKSGEQIPAREQTELVSKGVAIPAIVMIASSQMRDFFKDLDKEVIAGITTTLFPIMLQKYLIDPSDYIQNSKDVLSWIGLKPQGENAPAFVDSLTKAMEHFHEFFSTEKPLAVYRSSKGGYNLTVSGAIINNKVCNLILQHAGLDVPELQDEMELEFENEEAFIIWRDKLKATPYEVTLEFISVSPEEWDAAMNATKAEEAKVE